MQSASFASEFPLPPEYYKAHCHESDRAVGSFTCSLTPPAIPRDFSVEQIYNGSVVEKPALYDDAKSYKQTLLECALISSINNTCCHSHNVFASVQTIETAAYCCHSKS